MAILINLGGTEDGSGELSGPKSPSQVDGGEGEEEEVLARGSCAVIGPRGCVFKRLRHQMMALAWNDNRRRNRRPSSSCPALALASLLSPKQAKLLMTTTAIGTDRACSLFPPL